MGFGPPDVGSRPKLRAWPNGNRCSQVSSFFTIALTSPSSSTTCFFPKVGYLRGGTGFRGGGFNWPGACGGSRNNDVLEKSAFFLDVGIHPLYLCYLENTKSDDPSEILGECKLSCSMVKKSRNRDANINAQQ
jgi:hypothetical protein